MFNHVSMLIGCPNAPERHAEFRVEDKKVICMQCELDFTDDLKDFKREIDIILSGKLPTNDL